MKMIYIFSAVLLLSSIVGVAAEQAIQEDTLVEINGQKKTMIEHLTDVVKDASNGEFTDFSFTDVFRYEEEKYTQVGTVLSAKVAEMILIAHNNYVYDPYYIRQKDDDGIFRNHGAIIVGTRDSEHIAQLALSKLREAIPFPGSINNPPSQD